MADMVQVMALLFFLDAWYYSSSANSVEVLGIILAIIQTIY